MNPRARRIRRLRRKWVLVGEIGGANGHCWLTRKEVGKVGLLGINRKRFGKPQVSTLAIRAHGKRAAS